MTTAVTRFAPSPTGLLHLGGAFSAIHAHDAARRAGGRFLVRIEDIDPTRCRPAFEAAILEDLAWLGLRWDGPVRRQSEHFADYAAALGQLGRQGLLYPCFCTRRQIQAEAARSVAAPHGPDGPVYPGTCRGLDAGRAAARVAAGEPHAIRLDMAQAVATAGPLHWHEDGAGDVRAVPEAFGDIVLARKETPASYHLAVTHDDAVQGVTLVTRGRDLFEATHVHRLLQALLGLPVPRWQHHRLILSADGRRLAKRDGSLAIRSLREAGVTPRQVRERLGVGGGPD